ncbi:MAG: hypothetical protein MJZ84_06215 [Paludibacteraceae bacterium]|nr:hypothetical protein [Paludibacteraceae bacterium]
MKKTLLICTLLAMTSIVVHANEPYVLRHCLVGDTIATLQEVGGLAVLAVEANLTEDINKVEVVQRIDNYTVAWYGPKWKDYKSNNAAKIMVDGVLYIRHNDGIYNLQGMRVE